MTELSRSVWEKLDLGRVYMPHCIWLAETDIESSLDFPIKTGNVLPQKRCPLNAKSLTIFFYQYLFMEAPKGLMKKKSIKRRPANFGRIKLGSLPFTSKMSVTVVQAVTSYIKQIKLFLFTPYKIHILLTELSRFVWENFDLARVYRPPAQLF